MGGANQSISAGVGGFLAFFLLGVALWLLMRNMSGRLRNVRFDEELEDERRAAEAGDDVVVRPSRRQIFLPVRDDADVRETSPFGPDESSRRPQQSSGATTMDPPDRGDGAARSS